MITLVDYGLGNIFSVVSALTRLNFTFEVDNTGSKIPKASLIILPGVAEFKSGVSALKDRNQFDLILGKIRTGTPILGLCLGAQLLLSESEEAPGVNGLCAIEGKSVAFLHKNDVISYQGWAQVYRNTNRKHKEKFDYFYFSHSFHMVPRDSRIVHEISNQFGFDTVAVIKKDNIVGAQFHPERSGEVGLRWLCNTINEMRNE